MSSPVDTAFDALQAKYNIGAEFRAWLTSSTGLAATQVTDFTYAVAVEADIDKMISAANVPTEKKWAETSRVRQAWVALRKKQEEEDKIKARGRDDTDLDAVLPQPDLDSLADQFYLRYKVTHPPWMAPSDLVVSRIFKELDKRLLSPKEVWKVKSQSQMQKQVRKVTAVGDMSWTLPMPEDDKREPATIQVYLQKLHTLMLAYAIAGAKPRSGAPQEKRGTDTVLMVEVPLDIAMAYVYRARRYAESLPYAQALQYTMSRDEAEREVWIDRYRNTDQTLGHIIKSVQEMRESMWQLPDAAAKRTGTVDPGTPPTKRLKGDGKGKAATPPPADKKLVPTQYLSRTLKNGNPLCAAYNRGECSKKDCPNGKHLCSQKMTNDRICGGNHPAHKCTNQRRVSAGKY